MLFDGTGLGVEVDEVDVFAGERFDELLEGGWDLCEGQRDSLGLFLGFIL